MSDLESFVKLIGDNGALIIICAVFLWLIVKCANLGFEYIKKNLHKKSHDSGLDKRNDISIKIHSLISDYLEESNGKRIQVIEFSNSVMSVAYLPFKYMTCTYEIYQLGEKPFSSLIDHVSTSLFTPFFEALQDKDYEIFDCDHNRPKMGGAMYDILKSMDSNKQLSSMLVTSKGKALGYVSLIKDDDFSESDIEGIQLLSNKLSALLGIMDV